MFSVFSTLPDNQAEKMIYLAGESVKLLSSAFF